VSFLQVLYSPFLPYSLLLPIRPVGSRASQEFGNVMSFHLDEIRDTNEQQAVVTSLSNLSFDTTQTVFLFASPQVFLNNNIWRKLLDLII
jgi:hypothetical protein